jgi:hypothetical protein
LVQGKAAEFFATGGVVRYVEDRKEARTQSPGLKMPPVNGHGVHHPMAPTRGTQQYRTPTGQYLPAGGDQGLRTISPHSGGHLFTVHDNRPIVPEGHLFQGPVENSFSWFSRKRANLRRFRARIRADEIGIADIQLAILAGHRVGKLSGDLFGNRKRFKGDALDEGCFQPFKSDMHRYGRNDPVRLVFFLQAIGQIVDTVLTDDVNSLPGRFFTPHRVGIHNRDMVFTGFSQLQCSFETKFTGA